MDWGYGPWLAVIVGHHGEEGIDGSHWLVKMYTSCWSRAAASRWTWAIYCLSGTQLSEKCFPPLFSFLMALTSLSLATYDEAIGAGSFFCQCTRFSKWRCALLGFWHRVRAAKPAVFYLFLSTKRQTMCCIGVDSLKRNILKNKSILEMLTSKVS